VPVHFGSLCIEIVNNSISTRSIEYDEMTKQCSLSEEDSISQKDEIGMASSPTHHFYDFVCLDSRELCLLDQTDLNLTIDSCDNCQFIV